MARFLTPGLALMAASTVMLLVTGAMICIVCALLAWVADRLAP